MKDSIPYRNDWLERYKREIKPEIVKAS